MKSNFKKVFKKYLPEFEQSDDINIEETLNVIMSEIRFAKSPKRSDMAREIIRGRLTTALNSKDIYSFGKGHFVSLKNANEEQLRYFIEKANRDITAAEQRKANAELFKSQISMAWDENGNFIGFKIPEAMNL